MDNSTKEAEILGRNMYETILFLLRNNAVVRCVHCGCTHRVCDAAFTDTNGSIEIETKEKIEYLDEVE